MKTYDEISNLFSKHFKGHKNFMTPEIVDYIEKGKYIIEVSKGCFPAYNIIYGVTILELRPTGRTKETEGLNACCKDLEEVNKLIKNL